MRDGGVPREPVWAVYHRVLLPAVATCASTAAVENKAFKMRDFVSRIDTALRRAPDSSVFRNVNTPEDWAAIQRAEEQA